MQSDVNSLFYTLNTVQNNRKFMKSDVNSLFYTLNTVEIKHVSTNFLIQQITC